MIYIELAITIVAMLVFLFLFLGGLLLGGTPTRAFYFLMLVTVAWLSFAARPCGSISFIEGDQCASAWSG
jgi:hypothetical protein